MCQREMKKIYHHCYCRHINKSCYILFPISLSSTINHFSPTRTEQIWSIWWNMKEKVWFPNDDRINELFRTFHVLCWIHFGEFPGIGTIFFDLYEKRNVLNAYHAMSTYCWVFCFEIFELRTGTKNELSILHWVWISKYVHCTCFHHRNIADSIYSILVTVIRYLKFKCGEEWEKRRREMNVIQILHCHYARAQKQFFFPSLVGRREWQKNHHSYFHSRTKMKMKSSCEIGTNTYFAACSS